ncbi:hypothetical protein AB4254_10895 [Vibrio breoganii]
MALFQSKRLVSLDDDEFNQKVGSTVALMHRVFIIVPVGFALVGILFWSGERTVGFGILSLIVSLIVVVNYRVA